MVERIAHRDLRNRSAEILRNVAARHTYEVTNHGVVVAILSAPSDTLTPLGLRPAKRRGGWSEIKPVHVEERLQDALDELREDRA